MLELIVVVAAIVILAAAVSPRLFTWIDEGRAARAQNDAAAVAAAMNRFFQDTTRWPGQVEILATGSTKRFLTIGVPTTAEFPTLSGSIGIGSATCVNGLSGVKANVTSFTAAEPSPSNSLDLLDYLSRPPLVSKYPNWKGPYLSRDLSVDPWGRAFVINVIPLFCDETVTASTPGGALGFGWILSGGANRTIQTSVKDTRLDVEADDVGVSLGKRAVQSTGS